MALTIGNDRNRGVSPPPPKRKPAVDPIQALLEQFGVDLGAGSGSASIDYQAQMRDAYAPQFDYLDQLGRDATTRADASGKTISDMYKALQGSIAGQEKGIRQNYDQSLKDVTGAYGSAIGNVDRAFDSSRNGLADTLARLGIEEAAPSAVGKQSAMQALIEGTMNANNLAAGNTIRSGKNSAIAYNTQQKNAAGLAGNEQVMGVRNKLTDFLNQIGMQRATLNSQVNSSALDMQSRAQSDEYARMKDERDFNYRLAKDKADRDLELQKLMGTGSNGQAAKLDPLGEVNQLALQLYGNERGAGNAVMVITDALSKMSNSGEEVTFGGLLDQLNRQLQHLRGGQGPGDQGNLRQLAALLYDRMYG